MNSAAARAINARHADAIRERSVQDLAMDAPFYELKKERALRRMEGRTGAGGAASAAPPELGLVSNETKGGIALARIQIDPHASRVRRMRVSVDHSARLIDFDATDRGRRVNRKMITLTYRTADDWQPQHVNEFRRKMRDWMRYRGIDLRAVWVAELQGRGALHYHVVVWVPRGVYFPSPDKQGWWPHGSTNVITAHSPIAYLTKYASKTTAAQAIRYPRGARMHGAWGLNPENRRHVRYWRAPIWVRDALTGRADICKVRGGYACRNTGEMVLSNWAVVVQPDGRVFAIEKRPPT